MKYRKIVPAAAELAWVGAIGLGTTATRDIVITNAHGVTDPRAGVAPTC